MIHSDRANKGGIELLPLEKCAGALWVACWHTLPAHVFDVTHSSVVPAALSQSFTPNPDLIHNDHITLTAATVSPQSLSIVKHIEIRIYNNISKNYTSYGPKERYEKSLESGITAN